jgi:phosphate transport system substrate-binding protein
MQPVAETASSWFIPFVVSAAAAVACGVALVMMAISRRAEHRRITAALGSLGEYQADPVRGARAAVDEAVRLDSALAELRAILDTAPVGIIALDALDRIVTANPAAGRLLDAAERASEGRLLVELARSPELAALIAAARETGRRAEAEIHFASASGTRCAGCSAVPLSRGTGHARILLVLEDRTELRRLESLRTEFVANVSHELRTPITSIRGYAETLAESFVLPPDAARFAGTISRSAGRLGAIIDDLLLLSSLEDPSARGQLSATPVRVAGIVAEAVEQFAPAAAEKRIAVDVSVDPGLWVSGNAGLLAHAVANLLSNAVKYGPTDSHVRVDAHAEGRQAVISVADRGPGIPEVHRARLFERFYRVDRARSRDSGGTGLGLAIVKHVAMVHGGTADVSSRTDADHGTTFRIHLPIADTGDPRTMPIAGAVHPQSRSESNVSAIRTAALALTATVATVFAAGAVQDAKDLRSLKGSVRVDGSSTVFPISEAIAEEFSKVAPGVDVPTGVSGTGGGFKRFAAGETDVSNASRGIKKAEADACATKGIEYIELPIAYDGLTIVVNPGNTWARTLTLAQIRRIFAADGAAKTWKDVDPSWPADSIKVYSPGTDSGTFDYFKEAVVGKEGKIRADMSVSEDDNVLVRGVAGDKGAVGFFGYAYYVANKEKVAAVQVVNPKNSKAVAPSEQSIEDGTYAPFSRPLFLYVNKASLGKPAVAAYVSFAMANAAKFSAEVGYVKLPAAIYDRAKANLAAGRTGSQMMGPDGKDREGPLADLYK